MLEKSCGWWLIWYLLFFCHGGAEVQLQWVVKEKVTDYGQNLILFCPVENCCSERAAWSVGSKSIFIEIKSYSTDSSRKYGGTYNTDGFGVIIRNLSEADLNVTYHCGYGFDLSTPKYLLHGDVFRESTDVPDKDKDEENNTVTTLLIVGSIVVAGILVGAIKIVYRRKNKRQKSKGTEDEMITLMTNQIDPPTLNVHQRSHSVTTGNDVTLVCTMVSSLHVDKVQWQKTIIGLTTLITTSDNNGNKYRGSTNNAPSLTIIGASSSDAGTYTCYAMNSTGIGHSSPTTLSVIENPPTGKVQHSYCVTTGDDVILVPAVATSKQIHKVYWQRSGDDPDIFHYFDTNTNNYSGGTLSTPSLTISNASTSNAGTYICCVIYNPNAGQSTVIKLSVTENTGEKRELLNDNQMENQQDSEENNKTDDLEEHLLED